MSENEASASPGYGKKIKIFGLTLAIVGFVNFTAFFVIGVSVGGGPDNELSKGGKYFVSEHGKVTEVSERTFKLLRLHERSVWVTHPLAMFGFLIFGSAMGWKKGVSSK